MMELQIPKLERYFKQYLSRGITGGIPHKGWNYKDDLIVKGAYDLFCATGNLFYRDAIFSITTGLLHPDDKEIVHNLDFVSAAKTDLVFEHLTGELRYHERMERWLNSLNAHPRTKTGNFWHKNIYQNQVWLDGLYMAMPIYLQNPANAPDAMQQIEQVRRILFDENTKLYRHAWDEDRVQEWADPETGLSPCVWLRAEGWYLMALTDLYRMMPEKTQADRLAELLQEALEGILPYQDAKTKMFLQLVDHAEQAKNYPEVSGSAMVAYAMMKGVRLEMLEKKFFSMGAEILRGICDTYLIQEGDTLVLDGICGSAGLGPGPDNRTDRDGSVAYYLSEAIRPDNQHGTAACMMAYSELLFGSQLPAQTLL